MPPTPPSTPPSSVAWSRWDTATPRCPHCGGSAIGWGRARGRRRFRCRSCRRTFNEFTGTPLARTCRPCRCLEVLAHLRQGLTVRQSAARLGVHPTTAFRWRHRWIEALRALPQGVPGDAVEIAELALYPCAKGSRRRRARRPVLPIVRVILALDRRGRLAWAQASEPGAAYHQAVERLLARLDPDAVVCPERTEPYRKACARSGLLNARELLTGPDAWLRRERLAERAAGLRRRLRSWLRRFHGVATHYLERYVAWFTWLRGLHPHRRPHATRIARMVGRRLPCTVAA